jgi:addiction module HigA family antidote
MAKQTLSSPSAVLKKLLEEYGLNPSKLAAAISFNQATLRLIILGKGKISCPIALRLARFFGNTPEYWLNLQNQYDISEAAKDKELTAVLKGIKKATKAAPAKKEAKKPQAKADPKAKKAGRPAGTASKTAKADVAKKPAGRKPAAVKKAAEPKPAGAKRGRKPGSTKAKASAPNPVQQETPAPFPREETPSFPKVQDSPASNGFSDSFGTESSEE